MECLIIYWFDGVATEMKNFSTWFLYGGRTHRNDFFSTASMTSPEFDLRSNGFKRWSQRWFRIMANRLGAILLIFSFLTCLRGAFPPVDLRAVCLVRAMVLFFLDVDGFFVPHKSERALKLQSQKQSHTSLQVCFLRDSRSCLNYEHRRREIFVSYFFSNDSTRISSLFNFWKDMIAGEWWHFETVE